jgi:hypothetical protein
LHNSVKKQQLDNQTTTSVPPQDQIQSNMPILEQPVEQRMKKVVDELIKATNASSSATTRLNVRGEVDDQVVLQRDPLKGKAIDLGIPILETSAGPKLMADAQKAGYSYKSVDNKE